MQQIAFIIITTSNTRGTLSIYHLNKQKQSEEGGGVIFWI